ncbi:MAG TPA: hypothetical protein VJ226_15180, partial [Bradyrhizobium sp.]|nr:hypothetical protein [Bradyrhizobium sp.]
QAEITAAGQGFADDAGDVSGNNIPVGGGSYVGDATTVATATSPNGVAMGTIPVTSNPDIANGTGSTTGASASTGNSGTGAHGHGAGSGTATNAGTGTGTPADTGTGGGAHAGTGTDTGTGSGNLEATHFAHNEHFNQHFEHMWHG